MSELKAKCEDCNDTGVIFGTMGVEHRCHCQVNDVSDADMAEMAIEENKSLRTENEALKSKVTELEKNLSSEYLQTQTGLPKYVAKLEAQNARMREALEMIKGNAEILAKLGEPDYLHVIEICKQALKEVQG